MDNSTSEVTEKRQFGGGLGAGLGAGRVYEGACWQRQLNRFV
jgi:hypothetical protein